MRRLFGVVLTAACLAPTIVPANAGRAHPSLGRVNEFSGAGAAFTVVELPEAVSITNPQAEVEPVFSIRSEARFAGFALVYEDDTGAEVWVGGRVEAAGRDGYFFASANPFRAADATHTLPAGTYKLYVLSSDDSTTKVRLRLDELSGSTRLRLAHPAAFDLVFPKVHTDGTAQSHRFVATRRFTTDGGAIFGGSWYATEARGPMAWEVCVFRGRPPEDFRGRATGCAALNVLGITGVEPYPSQDGGGIRTNPWLFPSPRTQFVEGGSIWASGDSRLPGRFSMMFTTTTAAIPEDVQAMAFWLGF